MIITELYLFRCFAIFETHTVILLQAGLQAHTPHPISYHVAMVFRLFICVQEIVTPSHLLSPGQLVRCAVSCLDLSKNGFVSLKLSINPKDVNKELNSSSLKAGMVRNAKTFKMDLKTAQT